MFRFHKAVMLLIDPDSGRIRDANEAACRFYGYSREEFSQMTIQEINQLPSEQVALERQRARQEARNYFLFPHRLKDGSIKEVEVYSSLVESGDTGVLYSIIHPLPEKELLLQQLEDSRIRMELALRASGAGVWECDLSGDEIVFDRTWASMLGYEKESILLPLRQFREVYIHPEDRQEVEESLERHLDGVRKEFVCEHRLLHKSGAWIWVLNRGRISKRNKRGDPVRMFGTHTEFTDRKIRTVELQSLEGLSALVNVTVDLDTILQHSTELVRDVCSLQGPADARITFRGQEYLSRDSKPSSAREGVTPLEYPLSVHGERGVTLVYFYSPVPVQRYRRFLTVLTERLEKIIRRIDAEERSAFLLEEKDRLLKEIKHRTKNDLALVQSLLALQQKKLEGAEGREALEKARQRIFVVSSLYDLLNEQTAVTEVDILPLFKKIVAGHSTEVFRIEFSHPGGEFLLVTKRAVTLGIVLNEVITNAEKYAGGKAGSGPSSLMVALSAGSNGGVHLEIDDVGPGFPRELIEGRPQGFGTSLVFSLIQGHGGTVCFSNHHRGGRVSLQL